MPAVTAGAAADGMEGILKWTGAGRCPVIKFDISPVPVTVLLLLLLCYSCYCLHGTRGNSGWGLAHRQRRPHPALAFTSAQLVFTKVTLLFAWLQDDALLDDIIDRLLDVRTGRPGKQVALSETEVRGGWEVLVLDALHKGQAAWLSPWRRPSLPKLLSLSPQLPVWLLFPAEPVMPRSCGQTAFVGDACVTPHAHAP